MEGIILIFKAALLLNFLVGVAFAWAYYNRLRVYKIKYSRIHAAAESAVLIILGAVVFILIEKKYRDKYFYWKNPKQMVGEYILILGFIFSIVLSINVWVPLIRKLFTGKEYNHHED